MASSLIIPFIFIIMRPVPYYLQDELGVEFYPSTVTPVVGPELSGPSEFSTRIGQNLPGNSYSIHGTHRKTYSLVLISVPLYAQLERSMTNEARIYQQVKAKNSHLIKRMYFFSENCDGIVTLTEVLT